MSEIEKMYENAGVIIVRACKIKYEGGGTSDVLYPAFTAEKQLKIIKGILFSKWWMNLKRLENELYFEEGLAELINDLWQDLTEEERKQIKEILE